MAQKILTSNTIKAISNRVSEQLSKEAKGLEKVISDKITASKEWKQHLKLVEEKKELFLRIEKVKDEILRKHSTPIVNIEVYHDFVRVSENYRCISSDRIRDMLLIEEYMSGDSETPEELINRIVLKIKNG